MNDEPAAPGASALTAPHRRRHRGDIMSVEKRSAVMSRIRGKGTGPELDLEAALRPARFRFECHCRDLPGRPDFVFRATRVAVFVDGDFWHGWHFRQWRDKLNEKWEAKIAANRDRDCRNIKELRALGWQVFRIWEHEVRADAGACAARVIGAVRTRKRVRRRWSAESAAFSCAPGSVAE